MNTQAAHMRRQAALARVAERLRGQVGMPEEDRRAVLDAVDEAHAERAEQLTHRPTS